MIDEKTSNLGAPLPHPSNSLSEDVLRIRDALTTIDTEIRGVSIQRNRIDADLQIPNGHNALMIGDFEVGPDVTVTGLGNSTFRGI